ncbi:MAG: hypothetical protein U0U70_05940 [Chitinophagaceae bacterium]
MKKKLILAGSLLLSFIVQAQDKESSAYKAGYAIGKVVGFLVIAGLLIWGGYRLFRRKN